MGGLKNDSQRYQWLNRLTDAQLRVLCTQLGSYKESFGWSRKLLLDTLSVVEGVEVPKEA